MANRIVQLALLLASITGQGPTRSVFNVSGVVQYPDGKPSPGASVIGKTSCNGEPYSLVQETITAADGTFHLQFVDAECNRIRLSASKRDEFWLRTGSDIFYTKENGTSPVIELSANGSPSDIVVQLGELGGLVDFRVRDKATERFIYSGLHLERLPVAGAKFGSMDLATGRDGSPDTLLLPEGEYVLSVTRFACNSLEYFAARPLEQSFRVTAGQRMSKVFALDVRQITPLATYNNPRGKLCKPLVQ